MNASNIVNGLTLMEKHELMTAIADSLNGLESIEYWPIKRKLQVALEELSNKYYRLLA